MCRPREFVVRILRVLERRVNRRTFEPAATFEGARHDVASARNQGGIDVDLALEPRRVAGDHSRSEQARHPACIRGGHEMQRPAHRPGTDDGAARFGGFHQRLGGLLHAQANRPQ